MDKTRKCGCKGCRTCLICEELYDIEPKLFKPNENAESFVFCSNCNSKCWSGWNVKKIEGQHPLHDTKSMYFEGIYIKNDFLTEYEEQFLIQNIDKMQWDLSQSGRRKQNFGPKCNFKKQKIQVGKFSGFPKFSQFVQEKFIDVPILENFQTIEQCSLEYDPRRGASIDPHVDDCWIWGERIVTVNLLADSVLTLIPNLKTDRYNLECVSTYPSVLMKNGDKNYSRKPYSLKIENKNDWPIVRIPMARRSLLVIYGSPRYDWEHLILREDIDNRRICLAYREFTPHYLKGGQKYLEGKEIIKAAKNFF